MKIPVSMFVTMSLAVMVALLASCEDSGASSGSSPSPTASDPKVAVDSVPATLAANTVLWGGQAYRTVKIGAQNWMAENLNYSGASGKVGICFFRREDSCKKNGRLYTWVEVLGLPDSCYSKRCANLVKASHQGICPSGWHVPRDSEWSVLTAFVGEAAAGTRLRAKSGWDPSGKGTDDFGFSVLAVGERYPGGSFTTTVEPSGFWSASENFSTNGWGREFSSTDSTVERYEDRLKSYGYSLRCLQD